MKTYNFLPHLEFRLLFTYNVQRQGQCFHLHEEESPLLRIILAWSSQLFSISIVQA